jgi:hypothetical protein
MTTLILSLVVAGYVAVKIGADLWRKWNGDFNE